MISRLPRRPLFALLLVLLLLLTACSKKPADPAKLKKMDWKLAIDERGRMLPEIELFDQHHTPIVVAPATYTLTVSRPDSTVLCSLTRTLTKDDYDKTRLKSDWQDASCPADPAADELRVTLEVKAGDGADAPKLTRDKTTPTKFIYRHLATKPAAPATGAGSSAGSGDAKMVTPEAPTPGSAATGSAATGSAATGSAATGSGSSTGMGTGTGTSTSSSAGTGTGSAASKGTGTGSSTGSGTGMGSAASKGTGTGSSTGTGTGTGSGSGSGMGSAANMGSAAK